MNKTLTCIICPRGCTLSVDLSGDTPVVSGNLCPRGEVYGIEECTHPTRTVTSSVAVSNRDGGRISVKTAAPVPKDEIFEVMDIIRHTTVTAPIAIGTPLFTVCDGIAVVATKAID